MGVLPAIRYQYLNAVCIGVNWAFVGLLHAMPRPCMIGRRLYKNIVILVRDIRVCLAKMAYHRWRRRTRRPASLLKAHWANAGSA